MQITYLSDVHCEFAMPPEKPAGDVLVVAGDFTTAKKYEIHVDWLNHLDFQDVIYVLGNHEFYHGCLEWVYDSIKEKCAPHVHMLQNDLIEIRGQRFIGGTLWTDYDKENAFTMLMADRHMSDHKLIRHDFLTKEFLAKDALAQHKQTLAFLQANIQPGDVVVTHHAPSRQSIQPMFKRDDLNGAYVTDLEYLILEKEPKLWFHGHIHSCQDYMVGNTRILANPRGYHGYENVVGFDWHKEVTI